MEAEGTALSCGRMDRSEIGGIAHRLAASEIAVNLRIPPRGEGLTPRKEGAGDAARYIQ